MINALNNKPNHVAEEVKGGYESPESNDSYHSLPMADPEEEDKDYCDPNLRDPTDEELMAELSKYPIPENLKSVGQQVMPFSVEEYFQLFHARGSTYNFDRYFKYRGYLKISIT